MGFFFFSGEGCIVFFVFFVGGNGLLTGRVRHASYSPMAVHGKTVCLSTVSEEDLTSSLGALSAGVTISLYHRHMTLSIDFVGKGQIISALKILTLLQILMIS